MHTTVALEKGMVSTGLLVFAMLGKEGKGGRWQRGGCTCLCSPATFFIFFSSFVRFFLASLVQPVPDRATPSFSATAGRWTAPHTLTGACSTYGVAGGGCIVMECVVDCRDTCRDVLWSFKGVEMYFKPQLVCVRMRNSLIAPQHTLSRSYLCGEKKSSCIVPWQSRCRWHCCRHPNPAP